MSVFQGLARTSQTDRGYGHPKFEESPRSPTQAAEEALDALLDNYEEVEMDLESDDGLGRYLLISVS